MQSSWLRKITSRWFQKERTWSHSVVSDSLRPHELHAAYQSPLSLGFSRQEYWSGLTFPSPGYLRNPEIELLVSRIAVRRFTIWATREAKMISESESEVAQSCLTLCDAVDCSLPGSFVHGFLQARILEWVAMPSFRGSSQPRDPTQVSPTAGRFFAILSHNLLAYILKLIFSNHLNHYYNTATINVCCL